MSHTLSKNKQVKKRSGKYKNLQYSALSRFSVCIRLCWLVVRHCLVVRTAFSQIHRSVVLTLTQLHCFVARHASPLDSQDSRLHCSDSQVCSFAQIVGLAPPLDCQDSYTASLLSSQACSIARVVRLAPPLDSQDSYTASLLSSQAVSIAFFYVFDEIICYS